MMDMPTPSIGSSQYALTKPGAFGTTFSRRPRYFLAGHFWVLDADGGYYCMHGPSVPGARRRGQWD